MSPVFNLEEKCALNSSKLSAEQPGPIINCHDIPAPRGISFNSETKKSPPFLVVRSLEFNRKISSAISVAEP
ncbi:hypothetical protein D8674_034048 [Pyrus ussuriensis x Pyrus communis]|uniref:Uncharacterized protein n=1 Tax=Pyrus ussuriensis x Pyrus communis TaxID=2448454 RepID=A0A5N5HRC0_9ROSA|nr:hypothetical protein D8674_034048 [Pyrus ussuriensis x Pyrus communis]